MARVRSVELAGRSGTRGGRLAAGGRGGGRGRGVLWLLLLAGAGLLARRYLTRYEVKGLSMSPSLDPGDWLICESVSLRLRGPRRGELVVFESPLAPGLAVIKRVLAVEGDVVNLGSGIPAADEQRGGEPGGNGSSVRPPQAVDIGKGEVFVTGDNVGASTDSRDFGPIELGALRGVARVRYRRGATGQPGLELLTPGAYA